ncbi:hypothetical protein [Deinococcus cellulosilyticus]|uniref:Uncharacterized protein n=1 Tax=Deinococcus cellulosilyticus (strain DSM 18568 / NBRC 106333 / KACC 11606 / 5516J-15) TaxID=1223518 RepID=A0A511N742_DEIC1|nr:hypothetical protein [Deinococcus cellulosilyticus]GEM48672.1 hypothetical protein DC3_43070 [Deinococcus cellulosilyticus NBRC 106333 = KACC 11606]
MAAPTQNHRAQLAKNIFILRILEDGKPHKVPKNQVAGKNGVFQLPIPPQNINPRQVARIGYMETLAGAIADVQGISPPEWEIAGQMPITPTTANGVTLSAYAWQHELEHYLQYFLEECQRRARTGKSLLELRYHAFYEGQHWAVVPTMIPLGVRSSDSPLTERYTIRLKGLKRVDAIPLPQGKKSTSRKALKQNAAEKLDALCPHSSHAGQVSA